MIAVLSHVVLDEIIGAEADHAIREIGGAGAYAAVGASLAGGPNATAIVSGVGTEDRAALTEWFAEREIDSRGLFVVGSHSPRTRIHYFADGERIETPVFGLEHFNAHTPLPEHIPHFATGLAGAYLFHDLDTEYWQSIQRFRANVHGPILWEISATACRLGMWPAVRESMELVDLFSINRSEALELFDTGELDTAIDSLRIAGAVTILRCGADGSILIDGGRVTEVGVSRVDAIDPTGGGNSYSGAFLAAYAATGDPVWSARMAAAAAAIVISHHGAPPIDSTLRTQVAGIARSISVNPRRDQEVCR
ncbi:MAG: carbohydrate kinase family protein [Microbacteriaceae bacterium]|nr:MAG: carbohydrate kinase family protein [Microbacteriaceae bacterium]